MFKGIKAGGWWVTIPIAVLVVIAAKGGSDYWYLDRSHTGLSGVIAIIQPGER